MGLQVSLDEWADFVSDYRTYQTESREGGPGFSVPSIMFSKLVKDRRVIAEVHYYKTPVYIIHPDAVTEEDKIVRKPL